MSLVLYSIHEAAMSSASAVSIAPSRLGSTDGHAAHASSHACSSSREGAASARGGSDTEGGASPHLA